MVSKQSLRGLDWLNFFVANVQTGFGPFVAVYLTLHSWTGLAIGGMLSLGTIVAMASQLPAGALVDWMPNKRLAAGLGIGAIAAAALLFVFLPSEFGIGLAEILHGFASCMLNQAIAAITLVLVARRVLGQRLGRNARFASLGNGLSAAVMGIAGFYFFSGSVFVLTALLAIPALVALTRIQPPASPLLPKMVRHQRPRHLGDLGGLFLDRRLVAFMVCIAFFQLADAAMLPFIGNRIAAGGGHLANLVIGGAIVWPQLVVAAVAPAVGWAAERYGRRAVLLVGFAALPVRGLLFALVNGPVALMGIQGLDGIGAAVIGVLLPLIAADIAAERGHFNLTMGAIGLAAGGGAAVSTTLAGGVEQLLGNHAAFVALAAAGLIATVLVWLIMPESGPGATGAGATTPAGAEPISPSS
ncbi:MAG: MFS transporter [Acetobacteraceae bacterium]